MASQTAAGLTPEELKQKRLDALKASALAPYTGQLSVSPLPSAAPSPVVKMPSPAKTPGGGYDVRKAMMDKVLARYLPQRAV